MGRRSGFLDGTLDASELTLDELNQQIHRLQWRWQSDLGSSLRRDAFQTLVKLEAERERIHGIPAPERKFLRRT
jgi:hypothetical protein